MTTHPASIKVDPARLGHFLRQEAVDELTDTGKLTFDFSSVLRIDVSALEALNYLARRAGEKSLKITLRAVSPDIYKVLKLARLSSGFSFEP